MAPSVAIIIYSMYGHIVKMAEAEKQGVELGGGKADIFQVAETLPEFVLEKMEAPEKLPYPIATPATLLQYDGILMGISTRFGGLPAQLKTFWDSTGALWKDSALAGKFIGAFVSSGPGGGQEAAFYNLMSCIAHHGMIFVPLGYGHIAGLIQNVDEVHGGSPWGAGCIAGFRAGRPPSDLETKIARSQGKRFYNTLARQNFPDDFRA